MMDLVGEYVPLALPRVVFLLWFTEPEEDTHRYKSVSVSGNKASPRFFPFVPSFSFFFLPSFLALFNGRSIDSWSWLDWRRCYFPSPSSWSALTVEVFYTLRRPSFHLGAGSNVNPSMPPAVNKKGFLWGPKKVLLIKWGLDGSKKGFTWSTKLLSSYVLFFILWGQRKKEDPERRAGSILGRSLHPFIDGF